MVIIKAKWNEIFLKKIRLQNKPKGKKSLNPGKYSEIQREILL